MFFTISHVVKKINEAEQDKQDASVIYNQVMVLKSLEPKTSFSQEVISERSTVRSTNFAKVNLFPFEIELYYHKYAFMTFFIVINFVPSRFLSHIRFYMIFPRGIS